MTQNSEKRKPRLDAERNRQRLLDAARIAFSSDGLNTSLEEIARQAGVGIGTLYRHFPKREILVDEIYRDQGERLLSAAEAFTQDLTPLEALKKWLMLFIESLENKQIMAGILSCMKDEGGETYCALSGEVLVTALEKLIATAVKADVVTDSISASDILCAISGIASYAAESEWKAAAIRLVNTVLTGLTLHDQKL
ncbi:TetR family transcriptional regulator [Erwinia papayae]|uniref:TetR family transcriptional regulator n=1 Tax=Erwinia papayae TaxID=206499 RepID=A0ABV3N2C8_9GAMM